MATTPVSKATGSTPGLIRTFLLDHERLIIVVLAIALCWWGYGKYADIRAAHDNATLQQQILVTNQQAAAAKAQAAQAATDAQALQELQTKLAAQSAQIAQANATLAAALAARQKTDATLPLPELAVRWDALVPSANPVATATGVQVSPAGAVATVQALETIPVLKSQLDNETTLKTNGDLLIGQQNKSIFDLTTQVGGLQKLGVDQQKQCTDEIAVVKAQAAKSKRRWFVIGYVAGFLSRQFINKL